MQHFKIIRLMPAQSGVSQQSGNAWKSREVVMEEADQVCLYPDRYVVRLFGDMVDRFTAQEGDTIEALLHHTVHEHNGRFYGETRITEIGGGL